MDKQSCNYVHAKFDSEPKKKAQGETKIRKNSM